MCNVHRDFGRQCGMYRCCNVNHVSSLGGDDSRHTAFPLLRTFSFSVVSRVITKGLVRAAMTLTATAPLGHVFLTQGRFCLIDLGQIYDKVPVFQDKRRGVLLAIGHMA